MIRRLAISVLTTAAMVILAASCIKVDSLPQLEVRVQDGNGKPVNGAYVALFDNAADWSARSNPVQAWRKSDETGTAEFTDLKEMTYFIYARLDGKDNSLGEISTGESLRKNQKVLITIHIR